MGYGKELAEKYKLASLEARERIIELNAVVNECYEVITAYADGDQSGVGQKIDVTTLLKPLHDAIWQRK